MNVFPRLATPVGAVDCVRPENYAGPDDDDDVESNVDGKVALLVGEEES